MNKKYRFKPTNEVIEFEFTESRCISGRNKEGTLVVLPVEMIEKSEEWVGVKEVLFTTEDGVEIRDQDQFFLVRKEALVVFSYTAVPNSDLWKRNGHKTFSTREKANKYVLYSRPCLSLNDLLSIELDKGNQIIDPEGEFMQTALEIAKQKLRTNG